MFCEHCGTNQPDGSVFCEQCGARLNVPGAGSDPSVTGSAGMQPSQGYSQVPHGQNPPPPPYGQMPRMAQGTNGGQPRFAPPPPKKKGSPVVIAIIIILVLVLLVGGIVAAGFMVKKIIKGKLEGGPGIQEDIPPVFNDEYDPGDDGGEDDEDIVDGDSDEDPDDTDDLDEDEDDDSDWEDEDFDEDEDEDDPDQDTEDSSREDRSEGDGGYPSDENGYIDWSSNDQKYYSGSKTYVIAGSDSELISRESLKNLSDEDLRLAINEIYARHGRKFKSKELQDFFNGKDWYTPEYEPDEFDKKMNSILNKTELKNLDTMIAERDSRN